MISCGPAKSVPPLVPDGVCSCPEAAVLVCCMEAGMLVAKPEQGVLGLESE